jgi:hypothetical protein
MTLTEGQIRIMVHQFGAIVCPACGKPKQHGWCFCRGCYHALKTGNRQVAAGLWFEMFDGTDRFFESYQRGKDWLARTGVQYQKHDSQGGLFV